MQALFISFSGICHSRELSFLARQLNELVCSLKRELAVILVSFLGKCRKCGRVFPTLFTTENICLECAVLSMSAYTDNLTVVIMHSEMAISGMALITKKESIFSTNKYL